MLPWQFCGILGHFGKKKKKFRSRMSIEFEVGDPLLDPGFAIYWSLDHDIFFLSLSLSVPM